MVLSSGSCSPTGVTSTTRFNMSSGPRRFLAAHLDSSEKISQLLGTTIGRAVENPNGAQQRFEL